LTQRLSLRKAQVLKDEQLKFKLMSDFKNQNTNYFFDVLLVISVKNQPKKQGAGFDVKFTKFVFLLILSL